MNSIDTMLLYMRQADVMGIVAGAIFLPRPRIPGFSADLGLALAPQVVRRVVALGDFAEADLLAACASRIYRNTELDELTQTYAASFADDSDSESDRIDDTDDDYVADRTLVDVNERTRQLMTSTFVTPAVEEIAGENCPICLEGLTPSACKTSCGHIFHRYCIARLRATAEARGRALVCPMCRLECDFMAPVASSSATPPS
jgi:hypothetical protein